jgi:uncharacterized protein (DUF1015 family)
MARVGPFVALRYDPAVAPPLSALTAPPYDVISEPNRARFVASSPYNAVRLDLAEGSDDPRVDGNRYARAAELLASWEDARVLRRDPSPSYYAYEATWPSTEDVVAGGMRGVFVALALEPWGGSVVPHEETMPGPVEDRLRLLRATGTHLSAIYGTVGGPIPELDTLLDRVCVGAPAEDVTDEEHVRHRVWPVSADEPIATWLADEDLLIADGHHRYTTALAYRDERHTVDGPGPWDSILALIVDAGTQHVPVLPYHRVQITGRTPVLEPVAGSRAELSTMLNDDVGRVGVMAPVGDGLAYGVLELGGPPPAVRALHEKLLDEVAAGDALRFTHSAADAEEAVRDATAVAAYLLAPTTSERVLAAIERGERLPRKSTFFWPKPRTGLLFMPVR